MTNLCCPYLTLNTSFIHCLYLVYILCVSLCIYCVYLHTGYFVSQLPSNLILQRVGANVWLAIIMIAWASIALCFAFIKSMWGSVCVGCMWRGAYVGGVHLMLHHVDHYVDHHVNHRVDHHADKHTIMLTIMLTMTKHPPTHTHTAAWQFYTLRILLGVAEGGTFPGMWFHLSTFFSDKELGVCWRGVLCVCWWCMVCVFVCICVVIVVL